MLAKLKQHCQKDGDSCGASGAEALLKLHGLIEQDKFPLQDLGENQPRGYGAIPFLAKHKILATEKHYSVKDSVPEGIAAIETEANAGRFPLVVLPVQLSGNKLYLHVYVCGNHNGDLVLVDPVPLGGTILAKGRQGLATEFDKQFKKFPMRTTLHVMTYTNNN